MQVEKLIGPGWFPFPKNVEVISDLIDLTTGSDDLVLDFFAGSASTAHAVLELNCRQGSSRRFVVVQLPEPTGKQRYQSISDIAKHRIRAAARDLCSNDDASCSDLGFRVFKLDSSNIRAWEPDPQDLERTLLDNIEHIKEDRTEQDVLYELLLKLGLDLCVPIETRIIDPQMTQIHTDKTEDHLRPSVSSVSSVDNSPPFVEKSKMTQIHTDNAKNYLRPSVSSVSSVDNSSRSVETNGFRVHAIGAGVLMACLDTAIPEDAVEPLALGIVDWHRELAPVGDSTIVFRDSAFANDVAKTNLAAILQQHGLKHVRSL